MFEKWRIKNVLLEQASLIFSVVALKTTQGIKTMSAARGGRRRGTVFDELFDPEGLRIAYITIAAHIYTDTDTYAHTYT